VEHFLGFAIPGVPYGCTYAIVAVGLVLTYQATGVFNFAYGAQAYTSAFLFTWMVQNEGLPVWLSFVLSVVVLGPGLGLAFDRFLFRHIANTNTTAKLVTGIALFVGIPSVLAVIFGSANQYNPPSILFNPDTVYFRVAGTPINGIYVTTVVLTVVILVALVALMRFTNLGLQMRGAVESRRLIQLDGVNASRVVASAWAISGLMAGLAGVLLAPQYAQLQSSDYAALMVAAFAAAAWALLRSMPIAALVGILMGVASTVLAGYLPASSVWSSASLTSLPFIVLIAALLLLPGLRSLGRDKDPLSSVDPPTPPSVAALRAPQIDRIVRVGWYVILAGFVVSMLTWLPTTWENVFNAGLVYSIVFLSITLITGMGGQLSLAQATLAGVGAYTAAQLANHFGLGLLLGGLVGAVAAAAVATVLAFASVRLRGLGLALLTIAAALFFDNTVFPQLNSSNGQSVGIEPKWVPFGILHPNGHAFFITAMIVLLVCIAGVQLVRRGTTGRFLGAMRGSETAAAGLGINLTWQHIVVFALSGLVAGIGGTMLSIQQQQVNPALFSYQISLVFVVVVVTTGANTVEGALQAGFGFVILQQLLTYVPSRLGGNSLVVVFFAFGALTYAAHPEGILEYQKRRWTLATQNLIFRPVDHGAGPSGGPLLGAVGGGGPAAMVNGTSLEAGGSPVVTDKVTDHG
jgi:branched-subunit amino acid ABC-type transport system permease component